MIDGVRLLRRTLPFLAVAAVAITSVLPAQAATVTATRADEWWLTSLNATAAWQDSPGQGKGVTVAVLSTGVDATHPDLTGSVTEGPDYADTGRVQGDEYWGDEGTAVASLIAGHGHGTGGSEGITGIAPSARILSIQVTLEFDDPLNDDDPTVTARLPDAIAEGIRYAVSHGATVIALPLDPGTLGSAADGDPAAAGGSSAEESAVAYALAHNVVLVAPAGDNGAETDTANYPASYPGVIAVGATTRDGALSPFSNTGSYVDLTAPGSGVTPATPQPFGAQTDPAAGLTVAAPDGGYQSLASTDMAAALTAGVAALIRSQYPGLTATDVTQALEEGASGASGAGWGHGELSAATALAAAAKIAATSPATPSATAGQPATGPSTAGQPATATPATATAAGQVTAAPGFGTTIRSLLVGMIVIACVLIAALAAALAFTRFRRQRAAQSARSARLGLAASASRGSHGRHAQGPQSSQNLQSPQPPPATAPSARPAAARPATPWPYSTGPDAAPALDAYPPARPEQAASPAGRAASSYRPLPERLPWPPAYNQETSYPQGTGQGGWFDQDPVQIPEPRPAGATPQQEQSWTGYAAPTTEDAPTRPAGTGPLYVWNPSAVTSPFRVIDQDDEGITEG